MEIEMITTNDNSRSLINKTLDETYHSKHGALQESEHIFIKHGLQYLNRDNVKILEFGLGTGLNALLSLKHGDGHTIEYTSLEKYPINTQTSLELKYDELLDINCKYVERIYSCNWGGFESINEQFQIRKIKTDFLEVKLEEEHYDLIYFDAFSPSSQPELWSKELFEKIFKTMKQGGILVTYCCKGEVRRILKAIGFEVKKVPGPPGKREFIRAKK